MPIQVIAGQSLDLGSLSLAKIPPGLEVSISLLPETEPPSPGAIYVGEMMRIEVTVANIGVSSAEPALALYINGVQLGYSYTRGVVPGKSFSFAWHYNPPTVGTYVVRAIANGFEATASFEAIAAPPGIPAISIGLIVNKDIRSTPDFTYCWITLDAIIRNSGDGGGNWWCGWRINGALYYSTSGYLAAGAYDFANAPPYNPHAYGTYNIDVIFNWNGHHEELHRQCIVHQY